MDVSAEGIRQRYGRRVVLDGVAAHFGPGVTGILGPNGAGKSTLIKILATVMPPSEGTVRCGPWQMPGQETPVRRRLGYVPQLYTLYERMAGREFLDYAAAMKGLARPAAAGEVAAALEAVGLAAVAHDRIRSYSGGMRQRLVVGQALLGQPDLLILDEPTAGLDPEERGRLKTSLATLGARATVLLSTHIVSDLEDLADQVLVLAGGRALSQGSRRDLEERARGRVHEEVLALPEWRDREAEWARRPAAERPLVASVRQQHGEVRVRTVLAAPHAQAEATPSLEDGYLAVLADGRARA